MFIVRYSRIGASSWSASAPKSIRAARNFDAAHSERFADLSAREIYATLIDEGIYLGSISTMYRVLRKVGETRERRRLATHPARVKPELAETAPGQVWSWDITKLLGPQKWTYYHLYVVLGQAQLDVFRRYVVGWRLEALESATFATKLFDRCIGRENVDPQKLTVDADSGSAMTSKTLAQLFADLGVTRSRSRPHVSNDNLKSEAHFKTLKYCPTYRVKGFYASERDRKGHHHTRLYGISEIDYQNLLVKQGGLCACCKSPPDKKRSAVDHDHNSGAIRGLLCIYRNSMVGHADDDSICWLRSAIAYLQLHGLVELEDLLFRRKPSSREIIKPVLPLQVEA